VVLLAKDGKPFFQKAYGYADRDKMVSNNLDTRFRLENSW
jgi:CubicO group peptidase (beta-lactamase class C family)